MLLQLPHLLLIRGLALVELEPAEPTQVVRILRRKRQVVEGQIEVLLELLNVLLVLLGEDVVRAEDRVVRVPPHEDQFRSAPLQLELALQVVQIQAALPQIVQVGLLDGEAVVVDQHVGAQS